MKILALRILAIALALAFAVALLWVCLDRNNYGLGSFREIHAGLVYKTDGEIMETSGRRVVLLERPDGLFVLPELPREQPAIVKGKYRLATNRKLLVPAE